jgi:hypothetical protein
VGAGGLQLFFHCTLVAGELAEPLLKSGVFGGEPLECVVVMLALGVAETAEQLADAGALGADLGVGGLECLLGVQRPLLPGRLGLVFAVSLVVLPPVAVRVMAALIRSRAAGLS